MIETMAHGIATANFICLVCGETAQAGVDRVRWAPSLRGSIRHFECYGQPDRFHYVDGKLVELPAVAIAPTPQMPAALAQPETGLKLVVQNGSGGKYEPIPVEGEEEEIITPDPVIEEPVEQDGPVPPWDGATAPPPTGEVMSVLAAALAPHLGRMVDAETTRDIATEVAEAVVSRMVEEVGATIDARVNQAVAAAFARLGNHLVNGSKTGAMGVG